MNYLNKAQVLSICDQLKPVNNSHQWLQGSATYLAMANFFRELLHELVTLYSKLNYIFVIDFRFNNWVGKIWLLKIRRFQDFLLSAYACF